jgi:hypothetical protein
MAGARQTGGVLHGSTSSTDWISATKKTTGQAGSIIFPVEFAVNQKLCLWDFYIN